MRIRSTIALSALAIITPSAFAQFPRFNALQVSPVPNVPATSAVVTGGLTNSMLVCGYQSLTVPTGVGSGTTSQSRAFLWSVPTSSVNLGLPPGFGPFTGAQAKWVNDAGSVLAYASQFSPTSQFGNFVYTPSSSTWTQVSVPTGAPTSSFTVQILTDSGGVVGYYNGSGTIVPHRWQTPAGPSVQLPTPVPSLNGRQGTPIAANRSGQVLMTYIPAFAQNKVYVVGANNSVERILQSPAHMPTTENVGGINDAGEVVGWTGTSNSVGSEQRAFYWNAAGVPTQLFNETSLFQNAYSINNAGWIVGNGYTGRSGNNYLGVAGKIYIPSLGSTNLLPLVNAGQLPAGSIIERASSVNDSGQILVYVSGGATTNPNYILTPDNTCPLVSVNPPAALSLCNTTSFTLTAGGYAATPVSYLWRRNSQPLNGQNSPVLRITNATALDSGLYDCVISNTCGNAVTTPCNVTIAFTCGPADVGAAGGVYTPCGDGLLDNNDFIAFIDLFFAASPIADRGSAGGFPGTDNSWDNNDFIVFINQFFEGC